MEKTKDIEYEIGGVKRVFRLHAVKYKDLCAMRDAINKAVALQTDGVSAVSSVIISSIEMIHAQTEQSMGYCKMVELEALLDDGFALYDLICQAIDFQSSFCDAYPKSRELISVIQSYVCAGNME